MKAETIIITISWFTEDNLPIEIESGWKEKEYSNINGDHSLWWDALLSLH